MRFPAVKLSVFIVILALSKKEYNNGAVVTNTTSYEATVTSAALSWNKSKEETTAHPPSHNYRQNRRGVARVAGKLTKVVSKAIFGARWDKLIKLAKGSVKILKKNKKYLESFDKRSGKLNKAFKALKSVAKCVERGKNVFIGESELLDLFGAFDGPYPCYTCLCSYRGILVNCRQCLRREYSLDDYGKYRYGFAKDSKQEYVIEECYRERFGMDYRGTRDVTKSGRKCLTWEKGWERHQDGVFIPSSNWNDPPGAGRLEPTYKGSEWAGVENDKAYCRNPSLDKDGPWCYVEDKDIVKESCGIPNCEDTDSSDAFRPDGRCGLKFKKHGRLAECPRVKETQCCNADGFCSSNTKENCECRDCIDWDFQDAIDLGTTVVKEPAWNDPME